MATLRLLAFSDLHGSTPHGLALARKAKEAEVHAVLCAGDFSNHGGAWDEAIAPLVFAERKLLAVPGNHEPPGLMTKVVAAFPWVIDLDGNWLDLGPFTLAGFGAAGLDRPGWDPGAALEELARGVAGKGRLVLLTHVPPGDPGETGSRLADFCRDLAPELVLCGHVHSRAGEEWTIGPTRVVCTGRRGALVEL